MIKKTIYFIMVIIFMFGAVSELGSFSVYAQGTTKVLIVSDKTECKVGDNIKVSVQAQNVVDLFGLQFTIHYDPSVLEIQGDGMIFEGKYSDYNGTVDKEKGILTYPLINQGATKNKKDNEVIGTVTFKAIKKAPVIITMDGIKAVNTTLEEINYNTQTQTVFNILEQPAVVQPSNSNTSGAAVNPVPTVTPGSASTNVNQNNNTVVDAGKKETSTSTNAVEAKDNVAKDANITPAASEQPANNTEKSIEVSKPENKSDVQVVENTDKSVTVTNKNNNVMEVILLIVVLIQAVGTFIFLIKNKTSIKIGKKHLVINAEQESREA
jgi:hypothetical protein